MPDQGPDQEDTMIPTMLLDGQLQRLTDERRVRLSAQWGSRRRRAGHEPAGHVPEGQEEVGRVAAGHEEGATGRRQATPSVARPRSGTRPQPRHAAPEPPPSLPAPEALLLPAEPAGSARRVG